MHLLQPELSQDSYNGRLLPYLVLSRSELQANIMNTELEFENPRGFAMPIATEIGKAIKRSFNSAILIRGEALHRAGHVMGASCSVLADNSAVVLASVLGSSG